MAARQRGVVEILNQVKETLAARGAKTIRGLGRTFRALDSYDGNKKVDAQEFFIGLQENGVQLSQQECSVLFEYFDKDGDGHINFDEFLVGVRGKPNAQRQAMVDKAFLKFDRDGNGYVDAVDLRGVYNCNFHPKVQRGEMTEDQALMEFLNNFNDRNRDGKIQKDEWDEYYAAISSSIDNDQHFIELMQTAWGI